MEPLSSFPCARQIDIAMARIWTQRVWPQNPIPWLSVLYEQYKYVKLYPWTLWDASYITMAKRMWFLVGREQSLETDQCESESWP